MHKPGLEKQKRRSTGLAPVDLPARRAQEPLAPGRTLVMEMVFEPAGNQPGTPALDEKSFAGFHSEPGCSAAKTKKRAKASRACTTQRGDNAPTLCLEESPTLGWLVDSVAALESNEVEQSIGSIFDRFFGNGTNEPASCAAGTTQETVKESALMAASKYLESVAKELSGTVCAESESSVLLASQCACISVCISQCSVAVGDGVAGALHETPHSKKQKKAKNNKTGSGESTMGGELLCAAIRALEMLISGVSREEMRCSAGESSRKRKSKSWTLGAPFGHALCLGLALLRKSIQSLFCTHGENLTRIQRIALDGLICGGQPFLQRHAVALLVEVFSVGDNEMRQSVLEEMFLLLNNDQFDKGGATFALDTTQGSNPVRIHILSAALSSLIQSIPAARKKVSNYKISLHENGAQKHMPQVS